MFSEIEARRAAAGISQTRLCERAGIHTTTYTARKSERRGMSERTLQKLEAALEEMIVLQQKELGVLQ